MSVQVVQIQLKIELPPLSVPVVTTNGVYTQLHRASVIICTSISIFIHYHFDNIVTQNSVLESLLKWLVVIFLKSP